MSDGFIDHASGEFFPGPPRSFGPSAPDAYFEIPMAERAARAELDERLCVIDRERVFVRGGVELPVLRSGDEGGGVFTWGVWATLPREKLEHARRGWFSDGVDEEPSFLSWLGTAVPGYEDTRKLQAVVQPRALRQFPLVMLEPTEHALALEQRDGISFERLYEIAAQMQGLQGPPGAGR